MYRGVFALLGLLMNQRLLLTKITCNFVLLQAGGVGERKLTEVREGSAVEKKINRRSLLKWAGVLSASLAVGAGVGYGGGQTLSPPITNTVTAPPETVTVITTQTAPNVGALSEALKNRKSTNTFQTQPLLDDELLSLLAAAWGINRPDSGKRTAPSAMNAQEIDIYVFLPDGVYIYDAKGNRITQILSQDLRAQSTTEQSLQDAPAHLLFIADYAKFRNVPQSQMELYSAAHSGFIGQNVYLYCASEGLGAHFHTSIDRTGLRDPLKLRDAQAIVFGQVVGYPQ